jgi:hypothetical protein
MKRLARRPATSSSHAKKFGSSEMIRYLDDLRRLPVAKLEHGRHFAAVL